MKGRKSKPNHLKLIDGNPGRRPINGDEPESRRVNTPPPPDHLSDDAKAIWVEVVRVVDEMKILKIADMVAIEMLVEAVADHRSACAQIKANKQKAIETLAAGGEEYFSLDGRSYRTKNKEGGFMWRPHPAVGLKSDADRRIRGWTAEFGMTPSARSHIVVGASGGKASDEEADSEYFA